MEKQNKVRPMTVEEKETLLQNLKLDTTECTQTKEEAFDKSLAEYKENIIKQISNLTSLIQVNSDIIKLEKNYKKSNPSQFIDTEIETRINSNTDAKISKTIMEERLSMYDEVVEFIHNNYEMVHKVDFLFGNKIGFEDNKIKTMELIAKVRKSNEE